MRLVVFDFCVRKCLYCVCLIELFYLLLCCCFVLCVRCVCYVVDVFVLSIVLCVGPFVFMFVVMCLLVLSCFVVLSFLVVCVC